MFRGLLSGILAGALYGVVVMYRGGMPLYGSVIDMPEPLFGWIVFLSYTALLGFVYGFVFGRIKSRMVLILLGLLYGCVASLLLAFVLMPLFLEMPFHLSKGAIISVLPVIIGYTLFGALLAFFYTLIRPNE